MIVKVLPVGPFVENVYLVGDEQAGEGMLVDPGAQAPSILKMVKDSGLKVKYIANTHGHLDHVGAVKPVKEATGAPFGIHHLDVATMRGRSRLLIQNLMPDFVEPPDPDWEPKEGDTLEVGSLKFMVIETPGHTPGGLCFYGHGLLFSGDTLFNQSVGRTDFPGGDWRQLIASIKEKLLVLPEETVVLPGHGPHSKIGVEKEWNPFLR